MNKGGNFNGILNVLSALRQEDPYIFELCLKYPEVYTLKELKDNFKKEGLELVDKKYDIKEVLKEYNVKFDNKKTEEENFNKLSKQLDVNVQITNQKILEEDIIIDNKSDDWLYFVKTEDNKYMITNTKEKIKKKDKIDRPHRNIKPFCHVNPNVEVLWDFTSDVNLDKGIFGGFIEATVKVDSEAMWIEKLEWVKKYINEYKKIPSQHDTDIRSKFYGRWICTQKKSYSKNKYIMLNSNIKKVWSEFINNIEYKKYFLSNEDEWKLILNKIKEYIDKHKKRPSSTDKNTEIKKYGCWIASQIQKYKNNKQIMKNLEIYDTWTEFINNIKYKAYFISNEDEWKLNLDRVKKYIDENNKRPSTKDKNIEIKKDGLWICTQQTKYPIYKEIMANKDIRQLWEEFTNNSKYNKYFSSIEDEWKLILNKVKEYIDKNKKRPSKEDKNKDIKYIGNWICNQQKNYKNHTGIIKNQDIYKLWQEFINDCKYKKYFLSNEDEWKLNLDIIKKYIIDNNKLPSTNDKNQEIEKYGTWVVNQKLNYSKNQYLMLNLEIKKLWEEFINDINYKKYFLSNEDNWKLTLGQVKIYIDKNDKRPSSSDKKIEIKKLGTWIGTQQTSYLNNEQIMTNLNIRTLWEEFITEYQQYFPENPAIQKPTKKSIDIKPKKDKEIKETDEQKKQRKISEYQELTKKMSIQKSENTNKMFKDKPELWEQYHEARDFSFQGYEQDEIPVNKIISYLETKKNHRLKILDLGCGRNLIKEHFKDNKKFTITGYDHISYNGSKISDISNLEDEEEDTIDVCVYSQSLMGSNWKEYLDEGKIVLRYNGEMIISESSERYDIIKKYLIEIDMKIIKEDYNETKRWFYINVIKQ
jgi:hypothetical protein